MRARLAAIVLIGFAAGSSLVTRAEAETVLAVRQAALERNPYERIKMIRAAREALSPKAVALLVALLGDPHPRVRQESIKALSGVVDEASIAFIARAAKQGRDTHVRAGAVQAIGRIKSSDSRETIESALKDRCPEVRIAALDILRDLADPSTAKLVLSGLKDTKALVRAAAVEAIASVDPAGATWELMDRLSDKDYPVRIAVVSCLARIDPDEAIGVIRRGLADAAWQVRATAIEAAESLRRAEAIPLLIDRIDRENGRLRGDLLRALRNLTRKEIGLDAAGWRIWWKHHGKDFECPATLKTGGQAPVPLTVATFCSVPLYSRRVSFVLDLSGSMRDTVSGKKDGPRKIDIVKADLHRAIRSFKSDTRFNIILIGSDAQGRFDARKRSWMPRLTPATTGGREHAIRFSAGQAARGYTNIYDAVELAFRDPDVDTVVLLSDGGATKGTYVARTEILENIMKDNRWRKIAIHTIRSGARRGADTNLLLGLAERTGGISVKK